MSICIPAFSERVYVLWIWRPQTNLMVRWSKMPEKPITWHVLDLGNVWLSPYFCRWTNFWSRRGHVPSLADYYTPVYQHVERWTLLNIRFQDLKKQGYKKLSTEHHMALYKTRIGVSLSPIRQYKAIRSNSDWDASSFRLCWWYLLCRNGLTLAYDFSWTVTTSFFQGWISPAR